MRILIDIGNTTARLAPVSSQGGLGTVQTVPAELESIRALIDPAPPLTIICASVQPAITQALMGILNDTDIRFHSISHEEIPLVSRYIPIESAGIDRMITAWYASVLAQGNAIAVDLGTAITVEAVADQKYLGGYIYPGIGLMAGSLHTRTALLPQVEIDSADWPLIPSATKDAIGAAVFHGTAAAIKELVSRCRQQTGIDTPVYITGGNIDLFESIFDEEWHIVPQLLLEGLAALADLAGMHA